MQRDCNILSPSSRLSDECKTRPLRFRVKRRPFEIVFTTETNNKNIIVYNRLFNDQINNMTVHFSCLAYDWMERPEKPLL